MKNTLYKIKHIIKRYGPGEFWGTLGAVGGGYIASLLTHNIVVIGYAGAWSENIGYYGYFIRKEYHDQRYLFHNKVSILSIMKGLIEEFGIGELFDSILIRPFMMGQGERLFGAWGLLVGKIAADIIFYVSATLFYNRKTKHNIDVLITTLDQKITGDKKL